jgi:hypothetical protein
MNFATKRHLDRRTFLRGTGTASGWPAAAGATPAELRRDARARRQALFEVLFLRLRCRTDLSLAQPAPSRGVARCATMSVSPATYAVMPPP